VLNTFIYHVCPKLIVVLFFFSLLSEDFLIFYASLWFTNFGKSVFSTQIHELHCLQSPVKKAVGWILLFHEVLSRLWEKRPEKAQKQEYYTSLR